MLRSFGRRYVEYVAFCAFYSIDVDTEMIMLLFTFVENRGAIAHKGDTTDFGARIEDELLQLILALFILPRTLCVH